MPAAFSSLDLQIRLAHTGGLNMAQAMQMLLGIKQDAVYDNTGRHHAASSKG